MRANRKLMSRHGPLRTPAAAGLLHSDCVLAGCPSVLAPRTRTSWRMTNNLSLFLHDVRCEIRATCHMTPRTCYLSESPPRASIHPSAASNLHSSCRVRARYTPVPNPRKRTMATIPMYSHSLWCKANTDPTLFRLNYIPRFKHKPVQPHRREQFRKLDARKLLACATFETLLFNPNHNSLRRERKDRHHTRACHPF